MSFIKRSCSAIRLCADSTHSEINNVIKEWFRYARDREGGRKEREERKKIKKGTKPHRIRQRTVINYESEIVYKGMLLLFEL